MSNGLSFISMFCTHWINLYKKRITWTSRSLSFSKHFLYRSPFQPPDLSSLAFPPPHSSSGALLLSFLNLCLPPFSSQTHPQQSPWSSSLCRSRIMTRWQLRYVARCWTEAAEEKKHNCNCSFTMWVVLKQTVRCYQLVRKCSLNALKSLVLKRLNRNLKSGINCAFCTTTQCFTFISLWFPTLPRVTLTAHRERERERGHKLVPFSCGFSM